MRSSRKLSGMASSPLGLRGEHTKRIAYVNMKLHTYAKRDKLEGDDRIIYWPISDAMPATGQNARLIKFAGQKVTVTGKVFERSGSRALVIERIEPAPARK